MCIVCVLWHLVSLLSEARGVLHGVVSSSSPSLSPQLHQECYQALQDLQLRVHRASKEPTERHRPRHLHLAQRRRLEAALERAGRTSQTLGRVVSLANQMTIQGLCMLSQREVTSFLSSVIKVGGGGGGGRVVCDG